MLSKLSIKQKLVFIMVIPLILVLFLAGKLVFDSYNKKEDLNKIQKLVVLSTKISAFVHETQKERGMTAGFLGSKGTKFLDALPKQRQSADSKKQDMLKYLKSFDISVYDKDFQNSLGSALNQLKKIDDMRTKISALDIAASKAITYYTNMNGLFINAIGASICLSNSASLSQKLASYTNFLLSKERAGIERAVGSNTFARNNFAQGMKIKFNNLVAKQNAYADSFLKVATPQAKEFFSSTLKGEAVDEVNRMRNILFAKDSNFGIESKYWFTTITKKINLLKKVEDFLAVEILNSAQNEYELILRNTIIFGILSLIGIIITLFLARAIAYSILNDVDGVKKGLEGFFAFINFKSDSFELIKNDSKDEFAQMAQMINKNIQNTKTNIEIDKELIKQTIAVADKISKGHLSSRIKNDSNNPQLNELKNIINDMLNTMQNNIEKIISVLASYSKLDYRPIVEKGNLEGTLARLCDDVNILRSSISDSLFDNMKNGMILNENSKNLTFNLAELSSAANSQAASLEETAASLEELTQNLRTNTQATTQMAEYGLRVKNSVKIGHELANKTVAAMEDINTQTSSITDAITVIDQIAFQTNILSLNAAVEAATAGEAGKGFAVVAGEVRNLASRSAEAAKEIKDIVENAQNKTDYGKTIASDMIKGYDELNENISKTIEYIDNVNTSSKEQERAMLQINDSISQLDELTQKNAQNTNHADSLAKQTESISSIIINDVNSKEFEGKNSANIK